MATDIRTALLIPGLGSPIPDGDGLAMQVPAPTPDGADSPWQGQPGAPSYGEPSLDRVARALERVRQRALEPLLTAEMCPGSNIGASCRVYLSSFGGARGMIVQLLPPNAGPLDPQLLLTYRQTSSSSG